MSFAKAISRSADVGARALLDEVIVNVPDTPTKTSVGQPILTFTPEANTTRAAVVFGVGEDGIRSDALVDSNRGFVRMVYRSDIDETYSFTHGSDTLNIIGPGRELPKGRLLEFPVERVV